MAPPTQVQIDLPVTLPSYTVEYWNSGWVALSDDDVISVQGGAQVGASNTGLAFGAFKGIGATVSLLDTSAINAITWARQRIRVSFGFSGSDELVRVIGIMTAKERDYAGAAIKFSVGSLDELISDTAIFTKLRYRRPAATATTLTSIEDPTNGNYVGGLINEIVWNCGGRPLEQIASYPSAVFYYSFQQALIAPEWSWIAGEDAWGEIDRLCRACGGQLYIDPDGIVRYVNPLSMAPTGAYVFDEGTWGTLRQTEQTEKLIIAARCAYSARRLQPQQIVYEDVIPRIVAAGDTLELTIEPELPVYEWTVSSGSTLPAESVNATDMWFGLIVVTATISSQAAGRVVVSIPNSTGAAFIVNHLCLWGRPIAIAEEGQARYGSGTPEIQAGDDTGVYVQTRSHAERLCRMMVDFFGAARIQRELGGCAYDPLRSLGEGVGLTCAAWSLSAAAHRVVKIQANDTGGTMSVTLVDVSGIPTASDLFEIGGSYSGGTTKTLGY